MCDFPRCPRPGVVIYLGKDLCDRCLGRMDEMSVREFKAWLGLNPDAADGEWGRGAKRKEAIAAALRGEEPSPVDRLLSLSPYALTDDGREEWGVEGPALASDEAELVATIGSLVRLFDLEGEITITTDEGERIRRDYAGRHVVETILHGGRKA